jgi:hypothetical protein
MEAPRRAERRVKRREKRRTRNELSALCRGAIESESTIFCFESTITIYSYYLVDTTRYLVL